MKKTIALFALLASTLSFAGSTAVVWVRGASHAEVEAKLFAKVDEINSKRHMYINGNNCERPKVYAASAPAKAYRTNRFGELQEYWSATIKVSCRNND